MSSATRSGVHVDRTAGAWLVRRSIDQMAELVLVEGPDGVPADATAVDLRGRSAPITATPAASRPCSSTSGSSTVLFDIARIVHETDLAADHFDAPEAVGLDALPRGPLMVRDGETITVTAARFGGPHEHRRALLLGGQAP